MRMVTLINRTEKPLRGLWDGKHVDIIPGTHSFPEAQALAYKRQNPIMGSENPMTGEVAYKIGIVEEGDDVTPFVQTQPEGIERWDRSKLAGARPTEIVAGDNGMYQLGRTAGSPTLPADAGFVRP